MHRNTLLGLLGAIGIWLTAGLALPFVNVLQMFTPEQLMIFRGLLTALMALIGLRGVIGRVDRYSYLIALVLPFATLGLFKGIRSWGAGPTVIIVTTTPLINFAIAALRGKRISQASIIGMAMMLGGVLLASRGGQFQWPGFLWSVFGTVMNGILYELFARAKSKPLQKCFWACSGMAMLGILMSLRKPWPAELADPKTLELLFGFALVGGFLYWLSNVIAFANLPTEDASVLAQGETPAVILMAGIMLGENLAIVQWAGVVIALCGAAYLSRWLSKNSKAAAAEKSVPAAV